MTRRQKLATAAIIIVALFVLPMAKKEDTAPPPKEEPKAEETQKEPETISAEDRNLYESVLARMGEVDPDGNMSDEEIYATIAKEYDMTPEELADKIKSIQGGAIEQSVEEAQNREKVTSKTRGELQVIAQNHIVEQEMQKIKGSHNFNVKTYSYDPIKADGKEYKYSFIVEGQYEEKGNGKLQNFTMVLGCNDLKELDDAKADLLKYQNTTGTMMDTIEK